MAHWAGLERAARQYAATTPNFIPENFVREVDLSGSVTAYAVHMGHNLNTQRGEEALNFIVALYMFSMHRCLHGLGLQPYHPIPLLGGQPPAPNPHGAGNVNPPPQDNEAGQGLQPNAQAAAGNAAPAAAVPPVADLNEEEADDMLHVIMLD
jgi:hypothetical protein